MARTNSSTSKRAQKPVLKLAPVVSIQKTTLSQAARACIKELQHLLSLARKDQLHGFAYVSVSSDRDTGEKECDTSMVGESRDYPIATLGALELLKHDLLAELEVQRG